MRVIIQRVSSSSVLIDNKDKNEISRGLNILVGICDDDTESDIEWLVRKVINIRIFPDDQNVMNKSILDIQGDMLVISQFTLYASTKKGNRPSYIRSSKPDFSEPMYNKFVERLITESKLKVETGKFGSDMQVTINNDGPVTIFIDSHNRE
jgi:D-tyrosyl-tRNA(Tyr) deacylase